MRLWAWEKRNPCRALQEHDRMYRSAWCFYGCPEALAHCLNGSLPRTGRMYQTRSDCIRILFQFPVRACSSSKYSIICPALHPKIDCRDPRRSHRIVSQDLYERRVKSPEFRAHFWSCPGSTFPELSHGEAVAKGISAVARYSVQKGILRPESAQRLSRVLFLPLG